jgi:hypothetical protein
LRAIGGENSAAAVARRDAAFQREGVAARWTVKSGAKYGGDIAKIRIVDINDILETAFLAVESFPTGQSGAGKTLADKCAALPKQRCPGVKQRRRNGRERRTQMHQTKIGTVRRLAVPARIRNELS